MRVVKKQRIVIFNAVSAKSGGAATYLCNLAQEVGGWRHRCVFYVPPQLAKVLQGVGDDVEIIETDIGFKSSWRRFLWDQIVLRRSVKGWKADLLFSTSDFGMFFPPCKQILMIRNPLFFSDLYVTQVLPRKSWRFRLEFCVRQLLIALSARFSAIVLTASHSMLQDVKRHIAIPDDKGTVNPFGVPLGRFVQRANGNHQQGRDNRAGKFRLLYVSEYSDYKNLTTLLKAVIRLSQQGMPEVSLITTADPEQFPDVEIISRAADRALARDPRGMPHFRFVGRVPYQTITRLYQESDVFVFPSLAESFGHPLVEAMATGLPIIASDIPIHREMCGEAAVYFQPLDEIDLAAKTRMLRDDPELRARLGRAGRCRAETLFDWRDHVRRLAEVIERVSGAED